MKKITLLTFIACIMLLHIPTLSAQNLRSATESGLSAPTNRNAVSPTLEQNRLIPFFLTQSNTQNIFDSLDCGGGGESFFRAFDLGAEGITTDFYVNAVEFGIFNSNNQTVTINIYSMPNGTFPASYPASAILRGSSSRSTTPAEDFTVVSTPICAIIPAGEDLIYEIVSTSNTPGSFFIGSNNDGQTAPSYISSVFCGVPSPSTTASIGFPNQHFVMNILGDDESAQPDGQICSNESVTIDTASPGAVYTSTLNVCGTGEIGQDTDEFTLDNVFLDMFQHNAANELQVMLTAPDGTTSAMLFNNLGGTDGLDTAKNITFEDGGNDITTWTSDATFGDPYQAQSGPFNGEMGVGTFEGVSIQGDWVLTITNGGNSGGSLQDFCIEFTNNGLVGTVPTITCPTPNPFMTEAEPGLCSAEVVFADASAVDVEDGPLMVVRTDMTGLNSGDQFPVGTTTISFMVTDSDGNSAECDFDIIVEDTQAPTVTCAGDITQDNDAGNCDAMVTVPAPVFMDNCPVDPADISNDSMFATAPNEDASGVYPVGTTTVTYSYTDSGGNTITCSVDVTVEDAEAPEIVCEGGLGTITATETTTSGAVIINTAPPAVSTLTVADDFEITDLNIDLDITHTWVGDLDITLTSPAGTVVTVFDGSADGCSANDITTTLDDESANSLGCPGGMTNSDAFPLDDYMPNSPLSAFDGESTMGDWTLTVTDNFNGDEGILNGWTLEYSYLFGAAPPYEVTLMDDGTLSIPASDLIVSATDNCTADVDLIYANTTPGPICVYSNSDLATSDGSLSTGAAAPFIFANDFTLAANANFTLTDMSIEFQANTGEGYTTVDLYYYEDNAGVPGALIGSEAGVTLVEVDRAVFNADRDDILYTIDMADFDFSNPSATDATPFWIGTDAVPSAGNRDGVSTDTVNITGQQLTFTTDGGATWLTSDDLALPARDGVYSFNDAICLNANPDPTMVSFTCDNVGLNNVDVTVTDAAGNSTTCTAVVNVIDDTAPVLVCMDFTLELDDNGVATLDPNDAIDEDATVEACGYEATASQTDFSCADIGTPVVVDIFVIDPSGNVATCSATITVVDVNGPVLTCPDDQTVDPEANGVYTLEDFTGLTTATDGCDGNVDVISQSPAPGTSLGVGTYTITMTSADSTANESTCTFELTVSPIQGVGESELSAAIALYPNPATEIVNLSNNSTIALDRAAIYNVNGQLVSDINLDGMIGERTIDVSSLASGVYMVQVSGENNVVVKRLIIE